MISRAALSCGLALLLCAAPASAALFRTGQPVMGTVLQVTVVAGDDASARRLAAAAVAEARRWDDLLTTWRPQGELAQLNAQAGQGPVIVSAALAAALARMLALHDATGGAFDPAVGGLVTLWRGPMPPSPAQRAAVARLPLRRALQLDGRRATLAAGIRLDAGGVGKGMALDAIAALLRAGGAEAAYLDFGGSSQLAFGAPPGEADGWRVAVAGLGSDVVHGVVSLREASLSTSRAAGGATAAGPIIDPRSGEPVAGPRLATVRAADATTAEAWSKAVIILGRAAIAAAGAARVAAFYEDEGGRAQSPTFVIQPR